ncbi:MlaA family lipoprotein [Microbulbifer celer]|uniref:VacJ family lipoprotein n=1 Tax=Microbulbifer celer TaxID=435905 RepID=A0ABW3U478_9GAMM|nr:VacJ family lipoprotein [Microbulbifer celer]UFN57797.1 VacJ family lipoprotein [Microbulbifer celer]
MLKRNTTSAWVLAAMLASPLALAQEASDPFADDPFAESPAESGTTEPVTADPASAGTEGGKSTTDAGEATDDFGSEVDDGFGSALEDEYGFDPADEFASEEGQAPEQRDPWEGFNRAIFRFNDTADRWFLKPTAVTYRQVTPIFMQTGVSNFFSNLHEINNVLNNVLQWKWGQVGNDTGRFLVNSTVGIGGLFDVAQHMGLERSDGEDLGQTLAVWGVPSGPYLVLPFLGPSSIRDGTGEVMEWYTNPLTYIDDNSVEYTLKVLDVVQTRASLLQAESLLQGDRYVLMRDAYLQRREYLIEDGELEDDFGGDLDEYDF